MAEQISLPRSWRANGVVCESGPYGPPTLITCSTAPKGPWSVTFRLDGFTAENGVAQLTATYPGHGKIAITAPNPAAAQALLTGVMLAALHELLRGPSRAPLPKIVTSPDGATCKVESREDEIDGEQTLDLSYTAPGSRDPIEVVVTIAWSPEVTVSVAAARTERPLGSISNPVQRYAGEIVELVVRLLDALSPGAQLLGHPDGRQAGGDG